MFVLNDIAAVSITRDVDYIEKAQIRYTSISETCSDCGVYVEQLTLLGSQLSPN